jgi:hypothetical protein
MTSVMENESRLEGRVLSRGPHPSVPRWDTLVVEVSAADPVDDHAHLLGETVGHQVTLVANRDELPAGDLTGWGFAGFVRLAGPEVVEVLPEATGLGRPVLTPPDESQPPPPGTRGGGDQGPTPIL